jgi:hypothetical protein
MKRRGGGNLPKFLVKKLGKEVVVEALHKVKQEFLADSTIPRMAPRVDYHIKNYPNSTAKQKGKQKWREIQTGERQEDPLYSVGEALEKAGL